MPGLTSLLEFSRVSKAYAGFALRDVSFAVPHGFIVGLMGPNGAGKTTLMRLALGLAGCDAGSVRLFGEDPRRAGAGLRQRVGFVHDTPAFYDHLPVERMAAIVAAFYPSWDWDYFGRLQADFGVPARSRVGALSRGTRMKFALALALAHRPELLLLDEPTTGLDPVFRDELLSRLSACLADGQTSILFSTQIMTDLERIADFVVLVRDGSLLHAGPKDDIVDRWAVVRGAADLEAELAAASPWPVAPAAYGVEALFDDIGDARRKFGARALVERANLDDVFLLCRERPAKDA